MKIMAIYSAFRCWRRQDFTYNTTPPTPAIFCNTATNWYLDIKAPSHITSDLNQLNNPTTAQTCYHGQWQISPNYTHEKLSSSHSCKLWQSTLHHVPDFTFNLIFIILLPIILKPSHSPPMVTKSRTQIQIAFSKRIMS